MSGLMNKVMNFVGLEAEEDELLEMRDDSKESTQQLQFGNQNRKNPGKVVSMHGASQLKVVIMQPENFEDAQEICNHLKSKKPIVINLEALEKEDAKRVIDFLSGSVYALDGNIQKISNGIFIIAPHNVDLMGDFKDELRNKGVFPWVK